MERGATTGRRLPSAWARALLLLLLLGALVLLASSEAFQSFTRWVIEVSRPVIAGHPFWGAVLFVVLSALSAMLAFFSSTVLVPVAVGTWGPGLTLVLLWVGWILGGATAYTLAHAWGRPVVHRLISEEKLTLYEERISRHTPFAVVLLFQLGVPSEIPGYVLGLTRYGLRRYLVVLALAELPWAVGTIYLSESILRQRTLVLLALGVLLILFSTWALRTLHRRLGPS